ncbi:unnamed protein product, partial [Gulo gulo]
PLSTTSSSFSISYTVKNNTVPPALRDLLWCSLIQTFVASIHSFHRYFLCTELKRTQK